MKNIVQFPGKEAHGGSGEAESWLAILDRGNLSGDETARLQMWLDADPDHVRQLRELAMVWDEMDSLSVLSDLFPRGAPDAGTLKGHTRSGLLQWLDQRAMGIAMTCTVSFCLLAGSVAVFHGFSAPGGKPALSDVAEQVYRTRVGELSDVVLQDGSGITLNTQTTLRVRFDNQRRSVYLERGEAHFQVAKNSERPFVVHAGNGQVRAVGTAFSVRVDHWDVAVTVTEGTVEVVTADRDDKVVQTITSPAVPIGSGSAPLTTLTLTEHGVASYDESIQAFDYVEPEEIERQIAWKSGKWIFNGETLEEVIAEASRYTREEIVITDADIARLRIGGYFNLGELEPLLATLERSFGVRVSRPNKGVIELSGKGESRPSATL